jgi:exosortase K
VSVVSGSPSIFTSEQGYFHQSLQIIIDKSCSGFNFWILAFLMSVIASVHYFERVRWKLYSFPVCLFITYLFTIFVNTSRILISILLVKLSPQVMSKFSWLHEVEGTFIYFSFLIIFYFLLIRIYSSSSLSYEEPA